MSVFLRKQSRPPSNNDSFSISTSILDSTRPHIPRRLRPVSAEPVIRFPTEHIFQIEQCLEPYASQTVCKPKEIKSNMLHDIPSSVISRDGEYETNAISSDKLEIEAPQTIGGVSDAVRLPIDIKSGKRLCFNETLVVSRMDSATSAVPSGRKLHPLLNVDQLVPVGGMALNIDVINHKFVINSATQFSFEGKHVALATIQAEYTNQLMVKYEKRCETLCSKEGNDVCKIFCSQNNIPTKNFYRSAPFHGRLAANTNSKCRKRSGWNVAYFSRGFARVLPQNCTLARRFGCILRTKTRLKSSAYLPDHFRNLALVFRQSAVKWHRPKKKFRYVKSNWNIKFKKNHSKNTWKPE